MRQAGRYLPEFREIRKNNQNFIKLCLNPNLINKKYLYIKLIYYLKLLRHFNKQLTSL